jgi:hypothetical protein
VEQTLLEELGSPLDGQAAMHATTAVIKQGSGAAGDTGDVANSLLFLHPLKSNLENSISHNHHNHSHPHPPRNPDPAVMRAFLLLGLAAAATAMPEITSDGNTVSLMAPDGDVMVRVLCLRVCSDSAADHTAARLVSIPR